MIQKIRGGDKNTERIQMADLKDSKLLYCGSSTGLGWGKSEMKLEREVKSQNREGFVKRSRI